MCGSRILKEDDFQEFPNQLPSDCFLHASMNFKIFPDCFFLSDYRSNLCPLRNAQMLPKAMKQGVKVLILFRKRCYCLSEACPSRCFLCLYLVFEPCCVPHLVLDTVEPLQKSRRLSVH